MTALKVIGIILLIFLLIGFLRIGAIVSFGEALSVRLRVGHIKVTIIPGKGKKPKKPKKPKEEKPKEEKEEPKKKRSIPRPTLDDILDLIETVFSALGATARRACRRVRIDPLDVTVVFGGYDPANIAMAYGAASSVMYASMPKAEERFDVPNPSLHLRMDYGAESTAVDGSIGISLRVGDLFAILFTLVIPMLKWFLRFKKAHKHDKTTQKTQQTEENNTNNNDTEDKIA